ncbi:MAG: group III truncated hemoglobin [Chitinophagales bacterium]|nr:group III truncated hemoglobin [Chitinophagales bacterium]
MPRDIGSEEDVKLFSDLFYKKLLSDDRINHLFLDLNLEEHMPKIYDFWNTLLLGTNSYRRNMMEAHQHLVLKKEDFPIWLRHFESTLRENFEGDKTDEAISRANTIAMTMRYKLLGS